MKPIKYFTEAGKLWKQLSKEAIVSELELELEIQKKINAVFHVGEFYYYIFNLRTVRFDFVSDEMCSILGYDKNEIDVSLVVNSIHPDDQPWFLNFENMVVDFFAKLSFNQIPNYKVSYDYRIRKKNGEYIRILQQTITVSFDESGSVIRTLGIHTNISHIKPEGKPSISFIGLNGEPSFYNLEVKEIVRSSALEITKREREILYHLVNGSSSSHISTLLHISKQTVDTHRKNILFKTGCSNTAELISRAIHQGWI